MIPPKQVQEILDAVRIEDVVGDFVTLRRRGVNLLGLCPFHNEKTPSFNVNPARNIFKCFGCGKAGDAVTFLREHESFGYPDALRWLARKYNIEIQEIERTPEQLAEQQYTDSLYIVNDFALQHFQTQLFDTDEGKSVALSYFKKRGLREETIRAFGLGYAPDLRDLLVQRAKTAGYSLDLLQKLGLCSTDGSRDFFRGRVMFAIHNLSGKVAAFAGRTLSADKTVPKYINSPETEVYVKNKILFGAYQARKAIRQLDECILVEGYMDVISLHQAGIENVVASSGTSLTEGQLQLIKRNTDNLKIVYDGDPAGIKAALRGLDLALEQDMNVRLLLLPEGEDPDSYVQKHGGAALTDYAARESRDFILFKTQLLIEETKGDPIKKAGLVKDIVASIAKIPDPIKRSVYLKECASLLEVSEQALISEANKLITAAVKKRAEKDARHPGAGEDSPHAGPPGYDWPVAPPLETYSSTPEELNRMPSLQLGHDRRLTQSDEFQERDIIRILIQHGSKNIDKESVTVAEFVLSDIQDSLEAFENDIYGKIVQEYYNLMVSNKIVDPAYFQNHPDMSTQALILDILTESLKYPYSENWENLRSMPLQHQPMPDKNQENDTYSALESFKIRKVERMIEINMARIKFAYEQQNNKDAEYYTSVHSKLKSTHSLLCKKRGRITTKWTRV